MIEKQQLSKHRSGSSVSNPFRLLVLALAGIFSVLSLSSFAYLKAFTQGDFKALPSWNIFLYKNLSRSQEIKHALLENDKALEYMVWQTEQRKLLIASLNLTHELLLLDPNDNSAWLALLRLQEQLEQPIAEKLWALGHAIELNSWRTDVLPLLAHYCLRHQSELKQPLSLKCDDVIVHLPLQDKPARLTTLVAVKRETLDAAFVRLGLSK